MEKIEQTKQAINGESVDLLKQKKAQDRKLSAAIATTLEIKNNFELYSYRIIPTEMFLSKFEELIEMYNTAQSEM